VECNKKDEKEIVIKLENINKIYKMGDNILHALKDVNLEIYKNDFVAIIGKSGSGKSTLMNIIGCLDQPNQGKYFLDGHNIESLTEDEICKVRNKKIGFIFQSFNLLPKLTAQKNVEVPLMFSGISKKKREEIASLYLEKVDLKDRKEHKPNELSGGQKQRVAIARAFVNNCSILLADEPTGNLDSQSEKEIMKILTNLHEEGATVIIVTHEESIAEHAKRVVTFKDGQIISDKSK
jgi:putative ABC transport system ATP-binding protein